MLIKNDVIKFKFLQEISIIYFNINFCVAENISTRNPSRTFMDYSRKISLLLTLLRLDYIAIRKINRPRRDSNPGYHRSPKMKPF